MTQLSLAQAQALINGALAAARQHGFMPMGMVVVDAAAQVVLACREDGASALRLDIAHGKAGAAIGMGSSSRTLAARAKDMPAFFGTIATHAQHPFIPQTGAVLVADATGAVIGAAGASGGTGDEDEQIVLAGIAAAGLRAPLIETALAMGLLQPPCACGIDVHAHVVPEHFPAYLGRTLPHPWPTTAPAPVARGLCHRQVLFNGRHYRTVPETCWSAPRRLDELPAMGLSHQVVSPMPELLSYWLDLADAQPLIRYLNEQTAALCAESGRRLLGLAAVPLQDVGAAVAELQHANERLGLVGVEIGSNVNGTPIGDARFDPFYAACVALDLPVFVHALKPAGMERLIGPPALEQVLGYPTDVGLAAASVITGGLLQRQPGLRIAFSHGGGTLAALLPRLQQGWKTFPALAEELPESPLQQAQRLYIDTLVYDAPLLRHLITTFGASQLMLGTDHPFNFHEPRPLARLDEAGLDAATRDALAFGNARRFLGRAAAHIAAEAS